MKNISLREQTSAPMRKELAKHIIAKSTCLGSKSITISPEIYTDQQRFNAEQLELFLKTPLLACLTEDIPHAGDMITFDAAGPSILIVRTKSGEVNAFLNMCTHRGAKLVDGCKHSGRISCPFHAWTFNLDGDVVGVPRRDAFNTDDLKNRSLYRVPVGEWGGLIFVKAGVSNERIDVQKFLGAMAPIIELLECDKAGPVKNGRLDVACNWKYALDTYGEGYHVGSLHKETVGNMFYGDINVHEQFDLHHRFSFASLQAEPDIENGVHEAAVASIYYIFPNVVINFFPLSPTQRFINVHRIFPGDTIGTSFTLMNTYKFGGTANEEDLVVYEQGHDLIMHVVGSEDFKVAADAWRNLQYAPKDFKSVFGRNETGTQNALIAIAEAINMPITINE